MTKDHLQLYGQRSNNAEEADGSCVVGSERDLG